MFRSLVPIVVATLLLSGCVEVRASSRAQLSRSDSRLLFTTSEDAAVQSLLDAFGKRGFTLIDRRVHRGTTIFALKGSRTSVMVVSGDRYGVQGSSADVGSVFYMRLIPNDSGPVFELWGKPMIVGTPVCNDEDADWVPSCAPVFTGALWPGLSLVTGREEAEVIRGIILELGMAHLTTTPPPIIDTPTVPDDIRCKASELPGWKTATATEKKELLKSCQPAATDAKP